MTTATRMILTSALPLPDEEKAALVDSLLESMCPSDPDIERAWDEEIGCRVRAFEAGECITYACEEVLGELRRFNS